MNLTDIHRFEMLVRVRDFGIEYTDAFKNSDLGVQMFAAVTDSVARLWDQGATQSVKLHGVKDTTQSKAGVKAALNETLNAISRTARAISVDVDIENKFRAPRNIANQRLAVEARGVWKEAAAYKDRFVALGMPETFLEDLDAEITEFEKATKDQAEGKEAHMAARAELEIALDQGLLAVLRLDAIVPNTIHDTTALTKWAVARHVERTPRSAKGATTVAPAPVAPTSPAKANGAQASA